MASDMDISSRNAVQDSIKEYYGKVLVETDDIKTDVCKKSRRRMSKDVKSVLELVHEDVKRKYFGCGTSVPDYLEGKSVLDMGSGSGQDCYVLSKLVGEKGTVIGLDMTEEQVTVAEKYVPYHTKKYGYARSNVRFVNGYIENMSDAGILDGHFDVIISNCVVNLCHDKSSVLNEAFRVLKVGGELYFSDVYTNEELPEAVRKNKVFWGEGAGALCWRDLSRLAKGVGFSEPLLFTAFRYEVCNEEMNECVGDVKFVSATYRLFKLPEQLEPACQAIYNGSIKGCEDELILDIHHAFKTAKPVAVSSEIATILKRSRFRKAFTLLPEPDVDSNCDQSLEKDPFKIAEQLDLPTCTKTKKGCYRL